MGVANAILTLFLLCIAISGIILLFGTKQDLVIDTNNISCDMIRECILLDIGCVNATMHNYFMGKHWTVESFKEKKAQKKFYEMGCMNEELSYKVESVNTEEQDG